MKINYKFFITVDILTVFRGGQTRLGGFVAHRLFFERALWDWLPLDIPQFLALCGGHVGQEAACVVPQLVAEDQHTAHSKISVSMDIHKSVKITLFLIYFFTAMPLKVLIQVCIFLSRMTTAIPQPINGIPHADSKI